MLDLQGITKSYRLGGREIEAVLRAHVSVGPGDFISVTGHSGSGKSTLLAMAGCILRPDSGSVLLDGKDLWQGDERDRASLRSSTFGFVFQFPSLVPNLTALENVLLPTLFGKRAPCADGLRLLAEVGLADKTDRCSAELSGGEQQRVAVARSLINRPRILLADEPTGDLDEETEREIMDFLVRRHREDGTAIILVTHSEDLARGAERRYRMEHGLLQALAS